MADKNIVRMEDKKSSGGQKFADFLDANRRLLVGALCLVIAAIVAYAVAFNIKTSVVKKNLNKIEIIEYSFTKDAAGLDEASLAGRRETALGNLGPFLKKGGIAGARANMIAADIYGQKKDWSNAKASWSAAASKAKGSYLASLCSFNAAAACEELGQSDEALSFYQKVCDDKSFVDRSRAFFNVGRIKEGKNDYEGAKAAYEAIAGLEYSNDTWNDLAKTRLLVLRSDGKIK